MSVNKAIIVGNIGADPELRYTATGKPVANLSVATNEVYTDSSGQQQRSTQWHRVIVWGKQAESCKEYLSKGRQVYVEGRLQTRQWEDREGNKRYTTEVVAQRVQFLGRASDQHQSQEGSFEVPAEEEPAQQQQLVNPISNGDMVF